MPMMFCVWVFSTFLMHLQGMFSLRTCMPGTVVEKAAQYRAEEQILASNTCRNISKKWRPNCSPIDYCVSVLFWGPIPSINPSNCAVQVRPDPVTCSHIDFPTYQARMESCFIIQQTSSESAYSKSWGNTKYSLGCGWWWEGLSQHIFPSLPIIPLAQKEKNKSSREVLEYLLPRQRLKHLHVSQF